MPVIGEIPYVKNDNDLNEQLTTPDLNFGKHKNDNG